MNRVLALLLLACASCTPVPSRGGAVVVSIPALLADPAAYDGKIVQIRGASVARFEAEFVCPGLVQIDAERSRECLWLMPGIGEGFGPSELTQFHNKWVEIVGRFNASFTGHGGSYGGGIVPLKVQVRGAHIKGDIPPPPEPSANNSFKPTPLRGAA